MVRGANPLLQTLVVHILETARAEAGGDEEEGVVEVELGMVVARVDALLLVRTVGCPASGNTELMVNYYCYLL